MLGNYFMAEIHPKIILSLYRTLLQTKWEPVGLWSPIRIKVPQFPCTTENV